MRARHAARHRDVDRQVLDLLLGAAVTATELLAKHRQGQCDRGDIVRAIVALDERQKELDDRLERLSEIVWRPILEGDD